MNKEGYILKAIHQNTGIKADNYLEAVQHLWMTFDPSTAARIFQKAMDQYAEQEAIAFGRFLKNYESDSGDNWVNQQGNDYNTGQLYNLYKQTIKP